MPFVFQTIMAGLIAVLLVSVLFARLRRRSRPGSAAVGAVYELLNEDKRNAIEIILEQRAEARDPEDKEGDLPQLERPKRN